MKRISYLLVLLGFIIASCSSEPKIDGSSTEKADASISKMKQQLTKEKAAEFDRALMYIAVNVNKIDTTTFTNTQEESNAKINKMIDGKTPDEIIAFAKSFRDAKRLARQKAIEEKSKADTTSSIK